MDVQVKLPAQRPAHVAETPLTPPPPALLVFGCGSGGKPCAAWFAATEAEAATAAARTMRLRTLPVETDDQRGLAGQLARGRVTPGGRARVPFAKHDLYARLVALAGEEAGLSLTASGQTEAAGEDKPRAEVAAEASAADAEDTATTAATEPPTKPRPGDRSFVGQSRPQDRAEIGLGSVVLAHEGPEDGWWEAEVIGINGRVFSLRWRDYPTQPTILRKAGELALLPPGEA